MPVSIAEIVVAPFLTVLEIVTIILLAKELAARNSATTATSARKFAGLAMTSRENTVRMPHLPPIDNPESKTYFTPSESAKLTSNRDGLGTMELASDVDAIDELGDSSMQTTSDTLGARDSEPSAPTSKEPAAMDTTETIAVPDKRMITTDRDVEFDAPTALQPSDMQLLGELRHSSLPSEKSAISGAPGTSRKDGSSGSETLQEPPTIDLINANAGARSKEQRRKTAPEATTTAKSDHKRDLLDLGYRSEPGGSSQSEHVSGTKRVFSATESASETLSPSTHQQSVKKKVKATVPFFEAESSQRQSRDAVVSKWGTLSAAKESLREVQPIRMYHLVKR